MRKRGSLKLEMKISGHEFEFQIKRLHSMWQIMSLFKMVKKIFNKTLNREAVKGAEEILKKGG